MPPQQIMVQRTEERESDSASQDTSQEASSPEKHEQSKPGDPKPKEPPEAPPRGLDVEPTMERAPGKDQMPEESGMTCCIMKVTALAMYQF